MNLRDLMIDEAFLGLPESEKAKVVETIAQEDLEFQGLPENEQMKVLNSVVGSTTPTTVIGQEFGGDYTSKFDDSVTNRFKNSVANNAALVSMAFPTLADVGSIAAGSPPPYSAPDILQIGDETSKSILEQLGGTPLPRVSEGWFDEIGEVAKNIAVDPLSYVGGPLQAGLKQAVKGAGKVGAFNIASAPGIVTGEAVGESLEGVVTGDRDTSGVGTMLGSLIFGAGTSTAIIGTGTGAISMGTSIWKNRTAKDDAIAAYSNASVRGFLDKVANSEGLDSPERIGEIIADFSNINKEIVGTDAPLLTALSTNPDVLAQTQRAIINDPQYKTNFVKRLNDEITLVSSKINEKKTALFGGVSLTDLPQNPQLAKEVLAKQAQYKVEVNQIDDAINNIKQRYNITETQSKQGEAIATLVKAKEKKAREVFSPQYNQIIKEATEAGATLPADAVENIYTFVTTNNIRDIFGKGTKLDSKIMSVLSPTQTSRMIPGLDETMLPRKVTDVSYKDLSFEQVDSLKRNINEIKRSKLSNEQRRKINQLDEIVSQARESIPGDFNKRLIDTDLNFYKEVGVPYGEQGIVDISSKKYAEEVAPVLMKNGSAMADFLDVAGEQGIEIARNTVLSNLYHTSADLTPQKMMAFTKKNKDVIDQIPGLEADIVNSAMDMEALAGSRKELLDKANILDTEIANNFLLGTGDLGPNFGVVARNMLNDRKALNKVLKDLEKIEPSARSSVKSVLDQAVIDQILIAPGGAIQYINNPENLKSISAILGPEYIESVKNFATLSDAIKRVDPASFKLVARLPEADIISRNVQGLDVKYVFSQVRDKISSVPLKVVRLASRISDDVIQKKASEALADILLDKEALIRFNKNTKNLNFSNPIDRQKIMMEYSSLLPARTLNSVRVSSVPAREEALQEESEFYMPPAGSFQ
jgi:hypothetical protein